MQFVFLIFSSLGIFFILRFVLSFIVRQVLKIHPFNQLYDLYLTSITSTEFENAEKKGDADQGWLYVSVKDVYEFGISGISENRLNTNLEYIKTQIENDEHPLAGKIMLMRDLMKVLPKQNNNAIQRKLYEFIVSTFKKIPTHKLDEAIEEFGKKSQFLSPEQFSSSWASIIAAWGASLAVILYQYRNLNNFPILDVYGFVFWLILLSCLPLIRVFRNLLQLTRFSFAIALLILAIFGLYANSTHTQINSFSVNLDQYGFGLTKIRIMHPLWLTIDDVSQCSAQKTVSIIVESGELPITEFRLLSNEVSTMDKDCKIPIIPKTGNSLRSGETFNFNLMLLDRQILSKGKITMIPAITTTNNSVIELQENTIDIYLEHPFWGFLRRWYLLFLPLAGAALVSDVLKWLRIK